MFLDANMLIWSLLTLYLTLKGIGSAFLPMLYVLGPLVVRESFMAVFKTINWKSKSATYLSNKPVLGAGVRLKVRNQVVTMGSILIWLVCEPKDC